MNKMPRWIVSALLLATMLGYGNFACAQTLSQTLNPSTCTSDASLGTTAWSNPANAEISDGVFATVRSSGSASWITEYIKCTGYGFSIPSSATITGITVNVERKADASNTYQDDAVRLVNAAGIGTTDRSTTTAYTTTNTYEAHGGSSDLWGGGWTPSNINSATFGAAFAAIELAASRHTVSVDNIQITVYYTIPFSCTPPSNVPAGVSVTCTCDTFARVNLSPSPSMFGGASWTASYSDGIGPPYINQTTGLLRLTENTGNNAKAATAPGIYPAAGNYVSVEFNHYAYNGTGADGVAVTLSDSSIPANPGGYGGSQGYAPEGTPGFAGGWLGVALDEYGNYSNPTEGRNGGTGFTPEEIGMRGPGNGTAGYYWITGTNSNPGGLSIDNHTSTNPSPGYMYQVVVDARNEATGTVNVTVNRDSTTLNGSNYAPMLGPYNVYPAAANAVTQGWITQVVPNYWQVSFTSSTGGSTNIHEIGDLRICAQTVYPPTGQAASGFSAIDSAYPVTAPATTPSYPYFQTGDIYMKLTGVPFKLWVAALTSSAISTGYSAVSNKYVRVNLVPNIGSACSPTTCSSACTGQAAVESGASQIASFTSSTPGAVLTPNFTLNSAYQNLVAVMKECTSSACTAYTATAPACSTDSFSVRPLSVSITSPSNNVSTTGTPILHAGSDYFTLTATTAGVTGYSSKYNGTLIANYSSIQAISPATVLGAVSTGTSGSTFPAATVGTPSSTATATFTYSDVGSISLLGPNSTLPTFVDDETWTSVDSVGTKNDCNIGISGSSSNPFSNSYSNTMDANGKYGCYIGTLTSTSIGRYIPDHFSTNIVPSICVSPAVAPLPLCPPMTSLPTGPFTYSGQPFATTVTALNSNGVTTANYSGSYAKAVILSAWGNLANSPLTAQNPGGGTLSNSNVPAATIPASSFVNGVAQFSTSTPGVPSYTLPSATPPTQIWLQAAEIMPPAAMPPTGYGDGVTSVRTSPLVNVEGATWIELGRTVVSNAYGAPTVPLPITTTLQYYSASSVWATVTSDGVTTFNTAIAPSGNVFASSYLPVGWTTVSTSTPNATQSFYNAAHSAGSQGQATFILNAPGASGSVNLNLNTPAWLPSVKGRATFGIFASNPNVIYLREVY